MSKKKRTKKKINNHPKKEFIDENDDEFGAFLDLIKDDNVHAMFSEMMSDDPLMEAFFSGLDFVHNEKDYLKYVDDFIDKNAKAPGIEEFAVRMQVKPAYRQIERYENLIRKKNKEWQTAHNDFVKLANQDQILDLCNELNEIYFSHKMYSRGIALCCQVIAFFSDDSYNFTASLMIYYCLLEKKENVEKLLQVVREDYHGEVDVDILLPVSIFYYVIGQLDDASRILLEMNEKNKGTKRFINGITEDGFDDKIENYLFEKMGEIESKPFTFETFANLYSRFYNYLMDHLDYFEWAQDQLGDVK